MKDVEAKQMKKHIRRQNGVVTILAKTMVAETVVAPFPLVAT